jgi:hypothetical protein
MKKGISNEQILSFLNMIADKNEYFASFSEKAMIRSYDECDDYKLTDKLISDIWDYMKGEFNGLNKITKSATPITILHTNAGTGKVLEACPSDNVLINAFTTDYTCKRISDLLNARTSLDFSYKSSVEDISHFFINGDNGNTEKYDIVFTQPTSSRYYEDIDGTRLTRYKPLEYYAVRSLDFVTKGGYACVFLPHSQFSILKANNELNNMAKLVQTIYNNRTFDEYACLIYKKK